MKPTVVLPIGFPEGLLDALARHYIILRVRHTEPASFPVEARAARVLITLGSFESGAALMDGLPKLGLICCYGTGFEGVDIAAARARGIAMTNGGDSNAAAVAEFAVGLMIASARDRVRGDRVLRRGEWRRSIIERMPVTPGLAGQRLGIYGLGSIGMKIAHLAAPFGVEIGYHNRKPRPDVSYAYHPSLLGLAGWADILMVAVRANDSNRHAINAEILAGLGRKGRLINISRGLVVDETALCDALEAGSIAGAALDVFEHEPSVPPRLLAFDDVILTPHMAAISKNAQRAHFETLLGNLEAFFAGRPLLTPVPSGP